MTKLVMSVLVSLIWMAGMAKGSDEDLVEPTDVKLDKSRSVIVMDKIFRGKNDKETLENRQRIGLEEGKRCRTKLSTGGVCFGELKCLNNICQCPPGYIFLNNQNGTCIQEYRISMDGTPSMGNTYEWACNPTVGSLVPGLVIGGSKPTVCTPVVTVFPQDMDDEMSTSFIAVDAKTGEVYFTGGVPQLKSPSLPCGNSSSDATPPGRFIQTYTVQCIDSRGITSSNNLIFDIVFPSCEVNVNCNLDGL